MWRRFAQLINPSLKRRMAKELEEAQHDLLSAQNHFDYYQAMVAYQRARIARLKQGELQCLK